MLANVFKKTHTYTGLSGIALKRRLYFNIWLNQKMILLFCPNWQETAGGSQGECMAAESGSHDHLHNSSALAKKPSGSICSRAKTGFVPISIRRCSQ